MENPKKFNPASLSQKDLEAAVEYYLGLHPKFFVYKVTEIGPAIYVNIWDNQLEEQNFHGFKPQLESING